MLSAFRLDPRDPIAIGIFLYNFYNLLGTIAANMGHSFPEFLGGYIGTGIIAVLGRANLLPNLTEKSSI